MDRVLPPLWRWYARKPRRSRWGGVKVVAPPGVFHPGLFLSTRFLLRHLRELPLGGHTVLDLGTGSGMLAIFAAKRGALVTATDISSLAIAATQANALANRVQVEVVQSDLFARLPIQAFDYIVINPPYYPAHPRTEADHAWYCGEDFGYFRRLFQDLGHYCHSATQVRMVLSEDCKLGEIAGIAAAHGWQMEVTWQGVRWGERNYIFTVTNG